MHAVGSGQARLTVQPARSAGPRAKQSPHRAGWRPTPGLRPAFTVLASAAGASNPDLPSGTGSGSNDASTSGGASSSGSTGGADPKPTLLQRVKRFFVGMFPKGHCRCMV